MESRLASGPIVAASNGIAIDANHQSLTIRPTINADSPQRSRRHLSYCRSSSSSGLIRDFQDLCSSEQAPGTPRKAPVPFGFLKRFIAFSQVTLPRTGED